MRFLTTYSLLVLTFVALAAAQTPIVLDPSPARVMGHPSTTPAEQLVVTNLNPNVGVNGGMYSPQGVAVDNSVSPPILYVADTTNHRVLAWKNASSLTNLQAPDLIIGQPDPYTTLPATNGGLFYPTGLLTDAKGNLYIADSGNNRILRYPAPFANTGNESPDIVLGQHDKFTARSSNQGGAPSQTTICLYQNCPRGPNPFVGALAMDSAGNLFVADAGNARVLRFPAASLSSGALDPAADIVIGQPSFTTVSSPSGPLDKNVLYIPQGVAFDAEGHLFVSDASLNRVVVFPAAVSSIASGSFVTAIRFAGIVTPTPSTATASTLRAPSGIVMINDGPAVMDTGNNRMLIFDSFSSKDWTLASGDTTLANPAPVAIAVLGQGSSLTNFTATSENAGNPQAVVIGTETPTFSAPAAGAVGGTNLFLVDSGNNRVLVYPNAASAGSITASASVVLGQSDFPYNSPNSIQGKEFFFGPSILGYDAGVAVDSGSSSPHLYVSDPNNNRVLGYKDARKAGPGVPADLVIGQPDLKTAVCNFGGVSNAPGARTPQQPTQSSLCYPTGLAVDPASGDLFVADSNNGRVLRFPAPFKNSSQEANLVLGQSAFTGISNPQASQSVMVFPYGLVFDPGLGLFVSDASANRVLVFPMGSPTNGEAATKVIGQSNFTATANTTLSAPHHIAEDSINEIYVADTGHNQIQIFNFPNGTSTEQPVSSFTGLSAPEAVWVNRNAVAGYQNDIWVGDGTGLSRFTVPNPLSANTPTLKMPAVEVQAGQSLSCAGTGFCVSPAVAITQDSFGDLYVADASNRVAIHYPALAAENGASFVCAMGCNLGGLTDTPYYVAPGAFASLFPFSGSTFASSTTINNVLPVPTTLAGLQVLVNGQPSPITTVASGQINFVVPFEAPISGTAQVVVLNASTSQILGSGSLIMNAASPGFFTQNSQGTGQIAALNCNKTPCENTKNSSTNPANEGSVLQMYLTGQGIVPNAPPDGQGSTGPVNTSSQPAVYVGATLASVQYSGLAPGYPGLWQINITIPKNPIAPAGFAAGVFPVLVSYQGLASNSAANNGNPAVATTIVINAPQ